MKGANLSLVGNMFHPFATVFPIILFNSKQFLNKENNMHIKEMKIIFLML